MTADNPIKALRERIIDTLSANEKAEESSIIYNDTWWLLGTAGCHLCSEAEQSLAQFQAVNPITYVNVDIAEFDEALMMQFATRIPVLLTPTQRLDYPFSVMDLQRLLS